jgi:hypothetical protein
MSPLLQLAHFDSCPSQFDASAAGCKASRRELADNSSRPNVDVMARPNLRLRQPIQSTFNIIRRMAGSSGRSPRMTPERLFDKHKTRCTLGPRDKPEDDTCRDSMAGARAKLHEATRRMNGLLRPPQNQPTAVIPAQAGTHGKCQPGGFEVAFAAAAALSKWIRQSWWVVLGPGLRRDDGRRGCAPN